MYFFLTARFIKSVTFLFLLSSIFIGNVFAQKDKESFEKLARGQEAINKLSERLPAIASKHGKSANELRQLLLEDTTLRVDDSDRLVYVDEIVGDIKEKTETLNLNAPETAQAAPFPYAQTFTLHSRPGSNRVIYLDFDGHVTTGTGWNTNYTSGQPITSAPFDTDGNPSSFSQIEQDMIQNVWQRVAEDYAPFDVDVTTQDPGDDAINRVNSADLVYGTRAVISPTNFTGNSIGGIAYVGVFDGYGAGYKPAFVMSANLSNSEKNIAEAASHEVGHNLGLDHDGTASSSYYSGHGSWAPIMGSGYTKSVTQWSKGEYPGANQTQDDFVIMQSNGAAIIADDHGDTNAAATFLSGSSISASGRITTRSDVDVFQFSTGGGNVTINLNPAPRGANLDIQAKISDAQGNVLATSDLTGLTASFNQSLSAGAYYLTVDGVGAGDLTTGYSDYASIGQYSISGTLVASSAQSPVAAVSANPTSGTTPLTVSFSSINSRDPDGTITSYSWNFGDGSSSTDPNPVHIYNSAGTFTAVLTVRDDSGLTDTESVVITASPSANQSPIAVAGANRTSGYAPLAINFSSAGSYDPDGTIVSYLWSFGDGTSVNQANPSYTYNNAGNYTATLTVTDNGGATRSSSVTINVQQAQNTVIFVNGISMSLVSNDRIAQAVITVYGSNGTPRPNVTVTGNWSGLTRGGFSGVTNASGQMVISSNPSKKQGTFTLTVTNLSATGYTYNPSLNSVTSASISN